MVTRRDFLKGSACIAAGLALGLPERGLSEEKLARVVLVRRKNVLNEQSKVNPDIIHTMLDEAVMALTDRDEPAKAWQSLFKADDTVGIKSNFWRFMPTPKELEAAMRAGVESAGVPAGKIAVDDWGVLENPVFKEATALINVRPLRTHYWAGIGGCLKNYIMFSPNPPDYHPDSCADLALLWRLPAVSGKTRLNVLSVIKPLFHGRGPHHYDQRYLWYYGGLIAGVDPVAVDAVGLGILQAKRAEFFPEKESWETQPKHVMMADTRHKLGTSDLNKIKLITLGWEEGRLI
ncbi:MAG: DUF362 domain-containing protein [Chitinivibrionia bacterium]|nr:DUF362 domain-containing protein [Chitinivibrionia bacterium]